MMLDLHVWGSAFGLPSIDPECLAAITYLHHALPRSQWRLVPSNDPSVSPSNLLPALNHDGVWTSGYSPILKYLTTKSLAPDFDANLTPLQQADSTAYKSFLAAHAAPLLDLSLYASAANWAATTRPAYSTLLTFPLTWTVPPLIRAEANKRVEHLGLADLDSDFDLNGGLHLSAGRDALPETFRRHIPAIEKRRGVREEMTPEQAVAIRLFGLAEDCFSVLDGALGAREAEKRSGFFDGTEVSSLDCLAFAYLVLMRDVPVPRCFLKDYLTEKTHHLSSFIDHMKQGGVTGVESLPWVEQKPTTAAMIIRTVDTSIRHIPSLGAHYANELRLRAERGTTGFFDSRAISLLLSFIMTGVAVGYSVYLHRSLQPFGLRTQVWRSKGKGSRFDEFGQLGAMLSSAMLTVPATGNADGNTSREPRFADVEIE